MIVSYQLGGSPALIIESQYRVAEFAEERGYWQLFQKLYSGKPISDWDYDELIPIVALDEDCETDIFIWVKTGRLAISRIVLNRKDRPCADKQIGPGQRGFSLHPSS